jgi:hypothetical protein
MSTNHHGDHNWRLGGSNGSIDLATHAAQERWTLAFRQFTQSVPMQQGAHGSNELVDVVLEGRLFKRGKKNIFSNSDYKPRHCTLQTNGEVDCCGFIDVLYLLLFSISLLLRLA